MLFHLAGAPHEQHDLAKERPDLCAVAVHRGLDWHDKMMASQSEGYCRDPSVGGPDAGRPGSCSRLPEKYCRRLEASDRGWAVSPLKERHPEEFR